MPVLFSDHMVLQAGQPVPVWGMAEPGKKITVSFSGQTKSVQADAQGKWQVTLDPLEQADSQVLKVEGDGAVAINDVLVGEVWLCSGQSNMVLPVSKAKDFEAEKAAANFPKIRVFGTKWVPCSPEMIGATSAAAYFFGREIHQKTGRPVGLIIRAAGGTPIEYWTDWEVQKDVKELQPLFAAAPPPANASQAASDQKQALEVEGKQAAQKKVPGFLFQDRILPLVPFAIRGVIWYQGEANSYTANANLYGRQLQLMIGDWRKRWGYDFPFIAVQLPEFGKVQSVPVEDSGRAWVRDGVLDSLQLPKTGLAVTLGTGEANNNHPVNKQEVGRRLALWALYSVYGGEEPASGPLPAGAKVEGDKIVVKFAHADGGLVAKDGDLKGFAIAGADKNWVWADAKIVGDTVIVSSLQVKQPFAVRYAWAGNPAGSNLYNGAGLPASPFRTDQ